MKRGEGWKEEMGRGCCESILSMGKWSAEEEEEEGEKAEEAVGSGN